MRHFLWLLLFCTVGQSLSAQKYVYTIKADSVKITNCDSAELIIENHTQGVPGFLYNTGNGRTIFKRGLIKINDSLYILGGDTLNINQGRPPLKWYKESSTPAGYNNYNVTGDYGVAIAGQGNYVYGINSAAIGGAYSTAGGNNSYGIGDNSVVVGGYNNLDSCVDCIIVGGDGNVLHPSAVNSVILGTGLSEIYPFNSTIASASRSSINGPSGNNGIGETILGGVSDTVKGDDGQILGGIFCNSYSFGEVVTGLYSTSYTPGSSTGIVGTDRLFNIGNGTSSSARSDAFTVLKNGNTTINGGAFVTGKSFLGGTTTPTALLHLGPGTATAGTAPLKFTSGPLLAAPEPGAVEYDGIGYYITDSTGTRHNLTQTDRIFKIYSQDYDDDSLTYTLIGWNAQYIDDPTFAPTVVSDMDIEITLEAGTTAGTVVTAQFQGVTIYTLTVLQDLMNEAYVIGSVKVNQDIKYANLYYVKGAVETIDSAGVVRTTNTAFRLYPQFFSNPTLLLGITGAFGRVGVTYTVDKKQQGQWLY